MAVPAPTTNVYSESVDGADSFYIGRGDAKSQLAEVLIYRGALTETQVADVEGYLRTKYAVSDPVTPVATDAIMTEPATATTVSHVAT